MKKLLATSIFSLLFSISAASASPAPEFSQGSIHLEVGGSINSKVVGESPLAMVEVAGKSGIITGITLGLNNRLALQYDYGFFKSEDSTILGMKTFAESTLKTFHVLYKLNSDLTLMVGSQNNQFSYGNYIAPATKSALHFGFTGTHKLRENAVLFATTFGGSDVLLKELGISYKLPKANSLSISYVERKVKNVAVDLLFAPVNSHAEYTMSGIVVRYGCKI